jgi:O-antigen ligase
MLTFSAGIVLVFGMLVSGGRGGLVAAFMASTVLLFLLYRRRQIGNLAAPLVIASLVATLLFAVSPQTPHTVSKVVQTLNTEQGFGLPSDFADERRQKLERAFPLIEERPLVGYGTEVEHTLLNPHNGIVSAALAGGLFAGFAAVWTLLLGSIRVLMAGRWPFQSAVIAPAALTVFLVRAMVESGSLFTGGRESIVFVAVLVGSTASRATVWLKPNNGVAPYPKGTVRLGPSSSTLPGPTRRGP